MNRIFRTQKTLTFREADPAQIMFFGNIFGWAHDTFELFLVDAGFTWKEYFGCREFFIPIRHTSADYFAPFFPGETYEIQASVSKLSSSSLTMSYVFSGPKGVCAKVVMIHTFVNPQSNQKTEMPQSFHQRFSAFLCEEKGAN